MKTRRSSGFTLVELLTVMVIIGILAAILIPVVGRIRESSRDSVCKSNLRQLGTAVLLYTNDHEGRFPPLVEGYNPTTLMWMESIADYGAAFNFTAKKHQLYYCPDVSDTSQPRSWGCPDYGPNDKLMVRRANTSGAPQGAGSGIGLVALSSVQRPAATLLIAESAPAGHTDWGSWFLLGDNFINTWPATPDGPQLDSLPALRHGNHTSFNAVFVDGHVLSIRYDDPRIVTAAQRRLFLGP